MYWTLFVLCWVVLPIIINYEFAGEFTKFTRFQRALIKRLKTILVFLILLVAFLIYMAYKDSLSK